MSLLDFIQGEVDAATARRAEEAKGEAMKESMKQGIPGGR